MTTQQQVEDARRRSKRIDDIYSYLSDAVEFVADAELQDEILDWMEAADDSPAATLLDHVEGTLAEFVKYRMYRKHGDGREDFPDACKGCRHYMVACPLFTKRHMKIERERLQDELVDASEDEVKQKLRTLAGKVGCHVITQAIEEWSTEFSELVDEGQQLRRRTMHLMRPKDEADVVAGELAEATGGDPS